jgi:hypothetical protein
VLRIRQRLASAASDPSRDGEGGEPTADYDGFVEGVAGEARPKPREE